jgi:hypothetical protein
MTLSYRARLDERSQPTLAETLARYDRLVARLRIALAIIVVLLSGALVAYHAIDGADAAVTTTSHTSYALRPCSTCREVPYPTQLECERAADAEAQRVGQTREAGGAVYTCVIRHNVIATFRPNPTTPPPVCPAAPASRQGTCPTGTQGTWTQTATVGPAPACTVSWSTAPAGACVAIPPPPPPPPDPSPAGTATLNWTPPALYQRLCMRDDQGNEVNCVGGHPIPPSAIEAYRITYNTEGGSRPQVVQVPGNVRTHRITGLISRPWYFSVKAVVGGNESPPSNVIVYNVR